MTMFFFYRLYRFSASFSRHCFPCRIIYFLLRQLAALLPDTDLDCDNLRHIKQTNIDRMTSQSSTYNYRLFSFSAHFPEYFGKRNPCGVTTAPIPGHRTNPPCKCPIGSNRLPIFYKHPYMPGYAPSISNNLFLFSDFFFNRFLRNICFF